MNTTHGAVDVIVAGAGHNGIVSAAHLAKAGLKVLVVEQNAARTMLAGFKCEDEQGHVHTIEEARAWEQPRTQVEEAAPTV